AYRGPPNAVPELDQYDLHDRVPTIYFLTSLSVPTDVYAKTADPLDASRKMHAISTAAQRTLTSGIQRAGTELMGIPWPRTLAHLAGEEAGGIPVVNDFPYAAVAMYIDSPRGELTREENNVTLMLMGLPGPESERTEDAARRRRSRRRWWTRLAELPDAVIQGRFWRPIRRERRPTRRMAALLIAVDLVAAEMGLWFSIPRIPRIPRKGVGVVCIAFTIISVLLAVEALDPLYVTWVGGWVSFYLLILGFIFRH
ncbi:hypothetical protein IMZ48_11585, partial [Candidatus Bathyarchaeota archaeon]|nr:hypothetical protein [Candidatus Bathyarchaeota archaeon]